jgi:SPP1 gp7 family putative phage head morphogenesis protein
MSWDVESLLGNFNEAIKWFQRKTPITKQASQRLAGSARQRAFWVAGVQQVAAVETLQKSLDDALVNGTTFQDWKKTARETLTTSTKQHVETVFRTNVQSAYSAGRQEQQSAPAYRRARPFLMIQTVGDGRRSLICTGLNGTIMPADDPRWSSLQPPYHYNCRTTLRSLRQADVDRRGGVTGFPSTLPAPGFGSGTAASAADVADGHDADLVTILRGKEL